VIVVAETSHRVVYGVPRELTCDSPAQISGRFSLPQAEGLIRVIPALSGILFASLEVGKRHVVRVGSKVILALRKTE
jgi:hypothetical protein